LSGDSVYNCTCRAGYYSTDAGGSNGNIPICKQCPVYTTSENGAIGVEDCLCRPGTFRKNSMSPECFDCLESSHDDTSYYCPGRGTRVACPANTSISHRFASTSASCIPERSMFFDSALGYFAHCDVLPYRGGAFSVWLPPRGSVCIRTCVSPGAVLTVNNTCRCDTAGGYSLYPWAGMGAVPVAQSCQCRPGWFLYGLVCTLCPRNAYCPDGKTQSICPITRTSLPGSQTIADCSCAPGYIPDASNVRCMPCGENFKCNGKTSTPCDFEEICLSQRIFIPSTCLPGTTRYTSIRSANACVFLYNTYGMQLRNRLFSNNVYQFAPHTYAVDNIEISNVITTATFQAAIQSMIDNDRFAPNLPGAYCAVEFALIVRFPSGVLSSFFLCNNGCKHTQSPVIPRAQPVH